MKLKLNRILEKINSLSSTKRYKPMIEVMGSQNNIRVQEIIATSRPLIIKLKKELGAIFYVNENDEIIIELLGIRFNIESKEDLFIINEVYNELTYEFQINSPVILVDIGMNIGISTMFFLQKQNIIKIIGYEPVQKTYQKLIKNLELNNFRDKVTALNFGLGKNDRIEIFEFSNEYKASVGLIGLNEYKQKSSKVVEKVQVEIKDAFTQISNILEQNIDVDIFIKMDCEGGEYEILPRLYETNLLKRIKYLVMEWHGIEFLDQKNIFNGFSIFYHKISPDTGMLYAVRNN